MVHGNAKSEAELRMALRHRVGLIVLDNFDEIDRLERLLLEGAAGEVPASEGVLGGQPVLVRVAPGVRGDTHEKISTGQADSKFGFAMAQAGEALARWSGSRTGPARAARAHRLAAAGARPLSPRGRRARAAR